MDDERALADSDAPRPAPRWTAPLSALGGWLLGRSALWRSAVEMVLLFIVLRVVVSLAGAVVASVQPLGAPCDWAATQLGWRPMPPLHYEDAGFAFLGIWERWDACWYLRVGAFGYRIEEDAVAFFPLYPSLIATMHGSGLDATLAGLVISGIGAMAAAVGVVRLVAADFGTPVARRTAALILLAPSAVFLLAPFTEPLFLALAVWALVLAREGRWGGAALLAPLAALTRAHGVLLILPLAWLAYRDRANAARPLEIAVRGVAVLAPAIAVATYGLWATWAVGESPWEAQQRWNQRFAPPWEVLATALDRLGTAQYPDHALIQATNLVLAIGGVGLFAIGLGRLPAFYSAYAAPHVALLAMRIVEPSPVASAGRFLLVIFPLFVVLALLLGGGWRFVAWLVVSAVTMGALVYALWQGFFVG